MTEAPIPLAAASDSQGPAFEYRWANATGAHGMARPEALEADGYVRVCQHPLWPLSWLMRREGST